MPGDYTFTVRLRDNVRRIGPIFAPSAGDAEQEVKSKMHRGEHIIDVFSGRMAIRSKEDDELFDEEYD